MDDLKSFTPLRQGAEARLYVGTFLGLPAVAKERFHKSYRHPELDRRITRERLKAEARSLVRCLTVGIRTPTVYFANPDSGLLIMEHLDSAVTAREYLNNLLSQEDQGGKIQKLADNIGVALGKMHSNGIIHGDLTTSNIMVDGPDDEDPQLVLLDFGLSFAEGSSEDKGVDLYVLERALLSTHPGTEKIFDRIRESYVRQLGKNSAGEVIAKFQEIRMRGRKRTMVG